MVKLIKTKSELIDERNQHNNKKIGFVPTMGNLHQGHLSLIQKSLSQNDITFVSIFVNPTQFGPNEDYNNYPRTLEEDLIKINSLSSKNNIIVFAPETIDDVYPKNFNTSFSQKEFDQVLCGASRPGHFNGVLSVIYHLFNLVRPSEVIFGQKDYQQLLIIKNFAKDMFPNIKIISSEIIREKNGLAMSSRNNYLSNTEKEEALYLYESLKKISKDLENNKFNKITDYKINKNQLIWDYLEILDSDSLKPIGPNTKNFIIAGAMKVNNKVRIIDNLLWNK